MRFGSASTPLIRDLGIMGGKKKNTEQNRQSKSKLLDLEVICDFSGAALAVAECTRSDLGPLSCCNAMGCPVSTYGAGDNMNKYNTHNSVHVSRVPPPDATLPKVQFAQGRQLRLERQHDAVLLRIIHPKSSNPIRCCSETQRRQGRREGEAPEADAGYEVLSTRDERGPSAQEAGASGGAEACPSVDMAIEGDTHCTCILARAQWHRFWTKLSFTQLKLPMTEFCGSQLCVDLVLFSKRSAALMITASGFLAALAHAWKLLLKVEDLYRQADGLQCVFTFLQDVENPVHCLEELTEGVRGSWDALASLVIGTISLVAPSGTNPLSPLNYNLPYGVLCFVRRFDGPETERTSSTSLRGVGVSRLFLSPGGYHQIPVAVRHGFFHAIIEGGKRLLDQHVRVILDQILAPSSVYYTVLSGISEALHDAHNGLAASGAFRRSLIFEDWSAFAEIVSYRLKIMKCFDDRIGVSSRGCDNPKCCKIAVKTEFKRCSGCKAFRCCGADQCPGKHQCCLALTMSHELQYRGEPGNLEETLTTPRAQDPTSTSFIAGSRRPQSVVADPQFTPALASTSRISPKHKPDGTPLKLAPSKWVGHPIPLPSSGGSSGV
ncbi:hypothetical protein B0H14DRAFT_3670935 [Mycena olivaceomarginata]|nr:hypothetical protein B0H14DRAFT_3670935 [Mycena olivaceomarginata]